MGGNGAISVILQGPGRELSVISGQLSVFFEERLFHMASEDQAWKAFIEGPIYPDNQVPWREDPTYATILEYPGLRDSIGGHVAPALQQAIGLVKAMTRVDLLESVRANRPAHGLCLGFGTNMLEPYDLLSVFELDRVHGYEWIGEQVIEAAQFLHTRRAEDALLPEKIRLHHGTISDLSALADGSIRVVYTANMFNREIPMSTDTFERAVQELLRVLVVGGFVLSRGSAGVLEEHLAQHCQTLLDNPLVSVFRR